MPMCCLEQEHKNNFPLALYISKYFIIQQEINLFLSLFATKRSYFNNLPICIIEQISIKSKNDMKKNWNLSEVECSLPDRHKMAETID